VQSIIDASQIHTDATDEHYSRAEKPSESRTKNIADRPKADRLIAFLLNPQFHETE
jgi:hypothetical protein